MTRIFSKLTLILATAILVTGCKQTEPVTYYYPDGSKKMVARYKGDQPTGEWVEYYEDGSLKSIKYFKSGLQTDTATYYYRNGNLEQKETYSKGRLKGEYTRYYPYEEGIEPISAHGTFDLVEHHYDMDLTEFPQISVKTGKWTYYNYDQEIDSVVTYLGVNKIYVAADTTFAENGRDILVVDSILKIDYNRLVKK